MDAAEENHILRYNYTCLEDEYNQYKDIQTKRNNFLQYKLNLIEKELKNILLGKSYCKIKDIYDMKFEEYLKNIET